jgi:hypothetical protein
MIALVTRQSSPEIIRILEKTIGIAAFGILKLMGNQDFLSIRQKGIEPVFAKNLCP